MDIEAIKTELHKLPFRPFAMVLADGSQVVVPHHDYLMFSPGGRTMHVFHSLEGYRIVDTSLVTQIVPNPAKSARKPGAGGKR